MGLDKGVRMLAKHIGVVAAIVALLAGLMLIIRIYMGY